MSLKDELLDRMGHLESAIDLLEEAADLVEEHGYEGRSRDAVLLSIDEYISSISGLKHTIEASIPDDATN